MYDQRPTQRSTRLRALASGTAALVERARRGVVLVEARPPGTPLAFGPPSRDGRRMTVPVELGRRGAR